MLGDASTNTDHSQPEFVPSAFPAGSALGTQIATYYFVWSQLLHSIPPHQQPSMKWQLARHLCAFYKRAAVAVCNGRSVIRVGRNACQNAKRGPMRAKTTHVDLFPMQGNSSHNNNGLVLNLARWGESNALAELQLLGSPTRSLNYSAHKHTLKLCIKTTYSISNV